MCLYAESTFGRLGDCDCVVFGAFILGLTEAENQEGRVEGGGNDDIMV